MNFLHFRIMEGLCPRVASRILKWGVKVGGSIMWGGVNIVNTLKFEKGGGA